MKTLVLTFHNIQDSQWFEKSLRFISKFYTFVGVDELAESIETKKPFKAKCLVTFDDGEMSFYTNAYPVLKKMQIPVVLFVSPKKIKEGGSFWFQCLRTIDKQRLKQTIVQQFPNGKNWVENYSVGAILKSLPIDTIENIIVQTDANVMRIAYNMNETIIRQLQKDSLVTFGAHTLNHPILANESDVVAEYEIKESIRQLEVLLGKPVKYFAYPNGTSELDYTIREMNILQDMGMRLAFTTNPGYVRHQRSKYEINRVGLTVGNNWHVFLKIMCPILFNRIKAMKNAMGEKSQRLSLRDEK